MRSRDVALARILESLACGCLGGDGRQVPRDATQREPRRSFFVHPDGDDAASGEALDQAWRSIDRVSQQDLEPGDDLADTDFFGAPTPLGAARDIGIQELRRSAHGLCVRAGSDAEDSLEVPVQLALIVQANAGSHFGL